MYRGDARGPEEIFKVGFTAHGKNMNLLDHVVLGGVDWEKHAKFTLLEEVKRIKGFYASGFVATSTSKEVAKEFPRDLATTGFLYEINRQPNAIDITELHRQTQTVGLDGSEKSLLFDRHAPTEKEMAVPHEIKNTDIKSVWEVGVEHTLFGDEIRVIKHKIIDNPEYSGPPEITRFANKVHRVTQSLTAVSALMDGLRLYNSFETSHSSQNYKPFFVEGVKIIGAWSVAYAAGVVAGDAAASLCVNLCANTKPNQPIGASCTLSSTPKAKLTNLKTRCR